MPSRVCGDVDRGAYDLARGSHGNSGDLGCGSHRDSGDAKHGAGDRGRHASLEAETDDQNACEQGGQAGAAARRHDSQLP